MIELGFYISLLVSVASDVKRKVSNTVLSLSSGRCLSYKTPQLPSIKRIHPVSAYDTENVFWGLDIDFLLKSWLYCIECRTTLTMVIGSTLSSLCWSHSEWTTNWAAPLVGCCWLFSVSELMCDQSSVENLTVERLIYHFIQRFACCYKK